MKLAVALLAVFAVSVHGQRPPPNFGDLDALFSLFEQSNSRFPFPPRFPLFPNPWRQTKSPSSGTTQNPAGTSVAPSETSTVEASDRRGSGERRFPPELFDFIRQMSQGGRFPPPPPPRDFFGPRGPGGPNSREHGGPGRRGPGGPNSREHGGPGRRGPGGPNSREHGGPGRRGPGGPNSREHGGPGRRGPGGPNSREHGFGPRGPPRRHGHHDRDCKDKTTTTAATTSTTTIPTTTTTTTTTSTEAPTPVPQQN